MKQAILLPLFFSLLSFSIVSAQEPQASYCHDQASWQQWKDILHRNPGNDAIHTAYALRVGLCQMVEQKEIELDRATRIFEAFRDTLLDANKKTLEDGESDKQKGNI